jgi:DNA-directed RNA polymerase I, II, and III subunit RPABC2
MQSKGKPVNEMGYESDSGSENEKANSDDEQTPKKDILSKVKSVLGFGNEEESDNSDANLSESGSGSETETETEPEEDEEENVVDDEGQGVVNIEEKPGFKSGFSKLLGSLKKAIGTESETGSAAMEAVETNIVKTATRKGKTTLASSRKKKSKGIQPTQEELAYNSDDEEGDSNDENIDEDDDESKLKKFDKELREDYLVNFHPESLVQNYDEIYNLSRVVRDLNGVIVDSLHKTLPIMTKYEKTRILGQRAKQINDGATPFVKVPEGVIDGYLIALKELEDKKIPFIIRRPLPNRGSEYWLIEDLEIIV